MTAITAGRTTPVESNLTAESAEIRALLVITFLYPIVICAIFFPSPSGDLREQINLAQFSAFYNWKNPPLQTWAAGLIALTGIHDSWPYIFAAQVLNFVGLAYLARTAQKFVRDDAAVP